MLARQAQQPFRDHLYPMDGMTPQHRAKIRWDVLPAIVAAIAANAPGHDASASFPHDSLAALRDGGFLALTAAPADGGHDAGLADVLRVVSAVGAACPSTALILSMQLSQLAQARRGTTWPDHLRRQVAHAAATRGALINALRVEPELGTPARGGLPATIARRTPEGWVLSGRKIFSTGAPGLTWGMVFARTDEDPVRTGLLLMPMDLPGIRIAETWDQLGLRASGSHDVVLDEVAIPADHAIDLRPPAAWLARDPDHAAWNATIIGGLYTGVATAARDWLIGFLRGRVPANLGAPLATLARMQEAVGAIDALLVANRAMLASVAVGYDAGTPPAGPDCGLIKHLACENAIAAVQQAVALIGNPALARRNPLERHLRDVLCARIHTPQADVALGAAGRAALLTPPLPGAAS